MNAFGQPKNDDILVFLPKLATSFDELFVKVNAIDQPKIDDFLLTNNGNDDGNMFVLL